METCTVTTFSEFWGAIEASVRGFSGEFLWWRGQARADWSVTPSLYHKCRAELETDMIVRFINRARPRYSRPPETNDIRSWLLLMQHHGLPTRLLDWSESPLVALFFAVREGEHLAHPGVLWALSPALLNKSQGKSDRILGVSDSAVLPLWEAAVGRVTSGDTDKIFAIAADHFDVRHMVQSCECTIHGTHKPLNLLPDAANYLRRIEIPAEFKQSFLTYLAYMGITESYLFPDLDHLAKDVQRLPFVKQPKPDSAPDHARKNTNTSD